MIFISFVVLFLSEFVLKKACSNIGKPETLRTNENYYMLVQCTTSFILLIQMLNILFEMHLARTKCV